jgi:hypothetical protein
MLFGYYSMQGTGAWQPKKIKRAGPNHSIFYFSPQPVSQVGLDKIRDAVHQEVSRFKTIPELSILPEERE